MLKVYDKLDDIPETLREHYKLIQGKYVPEISDDHPVKLNNTQLLNEKTTAETKAASLQADLDSAKASSLPRGHVAVTKGEADMLSEYKSLGSAPAEVKVKLTEHESMKADLSKRQRQDSLKQVAKELGYNDEVFARLSDLPEFRIDEKDGKKSIVALIQDGDKTVEKPGLEHIESTYAPFMPALKAQQGMETPGSGGGTQSSGKDPFASAKEFANQWNEKAKAGTDVESRFGLAKSA